MKKAIIGAGGFAREIQAAMRIDCKFFVDEEYTNEIAKSISEFNPEEYVMMVAVADSKARAAVVSKLPKTTKYFTFIHPSVQIMDNNIEIGEGSFIGVNSILTTNIKIGKHALLNRGNHIGHDCEIGDYFSAMPNAIVGGNVWIDTKVYMGSCSNIREKIKITANTIIGMNAAIVKNITKSGTYVGVPAKKIK